jgi:2-keto-4-pentenoate hydratase/2-oxohepta-3-ene-1,7-dioic acid hydratase in catechol pathway
MRLGTALRRDGALVVAAAGDGTVRDVSGHLGGDLAAALADGRATALDERMVASSPEVDDLRWLPPIPVPRRVLCTGFNYRSHAAESDRDVPAHPTFFVRFPSSLVGHREPILRPPESDTLDWEGEIAFAIGRPGRRIAVEQALDHVAGYAPFGDHSVREYQLHGTQATAGKNFERTGAWGPWIVTPDEAGDPKRLEVRTFLNGEEVQHGRLEDLVFSVAEIVAYVSTFTTLEPGDVVATGTPQGIGFRRDPPRFLRPGDELAVEMVGHARVANAVADDARTR